MKIAQELALACLVFAAAYVSGQVAGTATSHNLSPQILAGIVVLPPLLILLIGASAPGLLGLLDDALYAADNYREEKRKKRRAAARARRQERIAEVDRRFRQYAEQFGVDYPGGLK